MRHLIICLITVVSFQLGIFGGVPKVCADEEYEEWEDDLGTPVSDPLGTLYDEAIALYKQHRYVEAKEKFVQVQKISPEAYPSSKAFLKRIDQHLAQQEWRLQRVHERQQELKQKKEEQLRSSREAQLKDLKYSYRGEKKQVLQKQKMALAEKKQKERELIQNAKARYKNALALYKTKRFVEARDQLQMLRRFLAKYEVPAAFENGLTQKIQKTEGLIEKGEIAYKKKIEEKEQRLAKIKEKREANAARAKERAQKEFAQKREEKQIRVLEEQRKKSEEVFKQQKARMEQLRKNAKAVRENNGMVDPPTQRKNELVSLLADQANREPGKRLPSSLKASGEPALEPYGRTARNQKQAALSRSTEEDRSSRRQLKEKLTQEVDGLYKDGVGLYEARQWVLAKNIFRQVDQLWPNYKLTRSYLTVIDENLTTDERNIPEDGYVVKTTSPEPDRSGAPVKPRKKIIEEVLDEYE